MRTALDCLVYALAVSESDKNPPPYESRLRFPIVDCKASFEEEVRTHRLGNLSESVKAIIESFQPYNRPHPDLPPLLGILRDLNNSDKHRLLRLAQAAVARGNIGFKGDAAATGNWQHITHSGEVADGTEIFAMVCDRPAHNMEYDRHIFDVIIALWHAKRDPLAPEWTDHTDFAALLNLLSQEVRIVGHTFAKIP